MQVDARKKVAFGGSTSARTTGEKNAIMCAPTPVCNHHHQWCTWLLKAKCSATPVLPDHPVRSQDWAQWRGGPVVPVVLQYTGAEEIFALVCVVFGVHNTT